MNFYPKEDLVWPFGKATRNHQFYQTVILSKIMNIKTLIEIRDSLTGNCMLNLEVDPETTVGSELTVQWSTQGAEVLTFGQGFTATSKIGVAGKRFVQAFEFNGVTFKPIADAVQID